MYINRKHILLTASLAGLILGSSDACFAKGAPQPRRQAPALHAAVQQARVQQQQQRQAQRHQQQQEFRNNHPARAEVLGRAAGLNRQMNEDKGDLNGHYGQLKSEDRSIRNQEQSDAAQNGGHLNGQQYSQLNHEENGLQRQVSRDNYGAGNSQFQANHPWRSQVLGRDAGLNSQINQDKGDLNGHYGQLKSEDNSIRHQEQRDAAQNGGHLTGQEYSQLNREENGLQRQVSRDNYGAGNSQFQANHPWRSQVLGRDAGLNSQINQDKGDLNGNYGQLKSEDNSIRHQEQRDAAQNGGHLTGQEYSQLNREENGLQRQVSRDNYGAGDSQFQANHPRRSEVLGRDASLNNQISQDKGSLSGQYGNLRQDDQSIRAQEQRDARRNGGYITSAQQAQLNGEENTLQSQISADHN